MSLVRLTWIRHPLPNSSSDVKEIVLLLKVSRLLVRALNVKLLSPMRTELLLKERRLPQPNTKDSVTAIWLKMNSSILLVSAFIGRLQREKYSNYGKTSSLS